MAKRLQMNTALFNAGKALNSVLDLDEVLDAILANALDLLGGVGGSRDAARGRASRCASSRCAASGVDRDARVKLGESIAGRVAQTA